MDTEDIDHWKVDEWTEEDKLPGPLLEESSFATLFPNIARSTCVTYGRL